MAAVYKEEDGCCCYEKCCRHSGENGVLKVEGEVELVIELRAKIVVLCEIHPRHVGRVVSRSCYTARKDAKQEDNPKRCESRWKRKKVAVRGEQRKKKKAAPNRRMGASLSESLVLVRSPLGLAGGSRHLDKDKHARKCSQDGGGDGGS